jgi:hypothetical protein
VPEGGCTGQSEAAWRIPVGLQMLPSLGLQIGMFFMPYSPRWLVEKNRDEEAKKTLSYLRKLPQDDADVLVEYLEIKAEVLAVREIEAARSDKATTKFGKFLRPYRDLVSSKSNAKRLFIGSVVMFYQQFIGCNAIIYYAPTSESLNLLVIVLANVLSLCQSWSGSQHHISPRDRCLWYCQHSL